MGQEQPLDDAELVFEDSSYGGSSSSSSDGMSEDTPENEGNEARSTRPYGYKQRSFVGSNLTRTLRKLRQVLWLVLFGIMTLSTGGMYWFSYHKETALFETEFKGHGSKLLETFQSDAHRKMEGLDSLSTFCTLHSLEQRDDDWLTIPHVSLRFEGYLSIVGAAALALQIVVEPHMRTEWEDYALQQQSWVDEALKESEVLDSGTLDDHDEHNRDEHVRWLAQSNASATKKATNSSQATKSNNVTKRTTSNAKSTNSSQTDSKNATANRDSISPVIQGDTGPDESRGPYVVWWQYAPMAPTSHSIINYNRNVDVVFQAETAAVVRHQRASMSQTYTYQPNAPNNTKFDIALHDILEARGSDEDSEPFANIHYPVFEYMDRNSKTVAVLSATIFWRNYFANVLPAGVNGVICVVENSKGQAFSYRIDGPVATYLGWQDSHDTKYDSLELKGSFVDSHGEDEAHSCVPLDVDYMVYSVHIYPSQTLESSYRTTTPFVVALSMVLLSLLTAILFSLYDHIVGRRQNVVMAQATKTDEIVSSLFPETVRARILGGTDSDVEGGKKARGSGHSVMSAHSHSSGKADTHGVIADLYPEATVLFTDIKGFTAWCSEREPSQVFILLETLYNTYDLIAKKRGVFKVETIGDCYMAVTGLPEPRADHAVVMCKFARECLGKMQGLLAMLEATLGPGTSNLSMRFGIHSGPVTAGVIRSQNARFQLFGDTVNTAARMESNGEAGRIHISQETALQLATHGKGHWYVPRAEKIVAKGKGELQTYWLKVAVEDDKSSAGPSVSSKRYKKPTLPSESVHSEIEGLTIAVVDDASSRLIDWIVDALSGYLQQIAAHRRRRGQTATGWSPVSASFGFTVFEELESTPVPAFDDSFIQTVESETVDLSSRVIDELYTYVHNVIAMYNDNPFHNFEHAAHVSMSVIKLLGRIDIPDDTQDSDPRIAFADPLTRFSCVLSAVIHDVGHNGVPNSQLVQENDKFAVHYEGRSVAEQVAIEVGWRLLMLPEYANLRSAIYSNEDEMGRFRFLLISSVMATDIADPELRHGRDNKWKLAFPDQPNVMPAKAQGSLQAVIAMEVLIQASDLAHTMQHWDVYRKWNERYFSECVASYRNGRAEQDPAENWYEGEIGFFDHCVIPLAKKMKECGVFGVSCEECLNYATKNRKAWVTSGREITQEMIAKLGR